VILPEVVERDGIRLTLALMYEEAYPTLIAAV
jgi:hypothetical protein